MNESNTKTRSHRVIRLAWYGVLAAGLLAGTASTASAHQGHHDRGPRYERHYVADYTPSYPRWLRKHREFKRWYVNSRHYRKARRHHRHANWHRLYEMYLIAKLEAAGYRWHRRSVDHDYYMERDFHARNRRDNRHRRYHDGD